MHRVVIFNENLVDVAERFLRKGSKVYIEGQLQTRKWQDQSGNDRYSTEVVLGRFRGELTMLDGRQDGESGGDYGSSNSGGGNDYDSSGGGQKSSGGGQQRSSGGGGGRIDSRAAPMDLDDDIPF